MYYRPCYGCKFNDGTCGIKEDISKKLKASGLSKLSTSISFKCKEVKEAFSIGTRVTALLDYEDEFTIRKDDINAKGTVVGYKGNKVFVWFDAGEGTRKTLFAVWSKRLTLIDEPKREVCKCKRPDGDAQYPEFECCEEDRCFCKPDAASDKFKFPTDRMELDQ